LCASGGGDWPYLATTQPNQALPTCTTSSAVKSNKLQVVVLKPKNPPPLEGILFNDDLFIQIRKNQKVAAILK
jgi:hypothetical protein